MFANKSFVDFKKQSIILRTWDVSVQEVHVPLLIDPCLQRHRLHHVLLTHACTITQHYHV